MTKQATFLMCSPRGEKSGSYSLGTHFSELLVEKGVKVEYFQIYKTLRKTEEKDKMVEAVNRSDTILMSTPLYIDQAPYMTIRMMDEISKAKHEGKIEDKDRQVVAIVCAGFLEYYHCELTMRIYQQFAKENDFSWAGGFPIGAAGTYVLHSVTKLIEMCSQLPEDDVRLQIYGKPAMILDEVMKTAAEYISKGKSIPQDELQKLNFVPMPLENYANGGNQMWINAAKELGTEEKLRDKPYDEN